MKLDSVQYEKSIDISFDLGVTSTKRIGTVYVTEVGKGFLGLNSLFHGLQSKQNKKGLSSYWCFSLAILTSDFLLISIH